LKTVYIIPNLFTSANIFCGSVALCRVVSGKRAEDLYLAGWLIFLAMILDLFDGLVARLCRATSAFGVQFDSLADFISFGVAPSFLAYRITLDTLGPHGRLGIGLAFLYTVFVAIRLARFNTQTSEDEKDDFSGMPCPIAAALLVSATMSIQKLGWLQAGKVILPVLEGFLCFMMVSRIAFPALGSLQLNRRKPVFYLTAVAVGIFLLLVLGWIGIFLGFLGYVVYNFAYGFEGKGGAGPAKAGEGG